MPSIKELREYIMLAQPSTTGDVIRIIDKMLATGVVPPTKISYGRIVTAKEASEIMVKGFKEFKRNA